ncbi:MAG: hypothetical protein ACUVTX_11625, partial [Bacteroidales bacterium]
ILIFLAIFTFPSCKWLKEKGIFGRKADTMAIWQARQDSIRVADSIRAAQERIALENQRLEQERLAEQQKLEWERKYKYNIIVGSFITPEYARNCLADFQSRGYTEARLIPLENTRFEMVAAEAHNKLGTAIKRLEQFQDTVAFDAWLYIFRR